jgi:hypothetical protein
MQNASDKGTAADRPERARRSRHNAWRVLGTRVKRPADIPPEIRDEYRQHARRMARLQRIRRLALVKPDQQVLERVAKLMAREHARHHKQLSVHFQALAKAQQAAALVPRAAPAGEENDNEIDPEELEEQENEERGEP